ncbi:hypothetical protein [Streptomyces sp. NPDC000410]|uniref:hypothetical protein n=1 Tax=Streptomyces sp. NPDC000410 TaxID=3154254 RepID=UPI0033260B90
MSPQSTTVSAYIAQVSKNAQLLPDEERCRSRNQQANADAAKHIWCHWRRFREVAIGSTLARNSEAPDKQSGTQHEQERADKFIAIKPH